MPPLPESRPKTVAAIPCFNTAKFIADVVSRSKKYVDQVIVINDGSSDSTAELARQAGAVVVNHYTNGGYGSALRSCFEAARSNSADILVVLDGDGQHNPEEIPLLVKPLIKHEADVVIGSRFIANGHNVPGYRRFGIGIITWLFNFGSRSRVSDAQSGFRAYSSRVFPELTVSRKGMSASIETLERARRRRASLREVPISCRYEDGAAHLNLKAVRHGLGIALAVLGIRLTPGR